MDRVTPFQQRVYECLRRVPRGRVVTYRELARAVGCRSAQAVGQALKKNPFAPEVPCHRVIKSDLRVGGFCGETDGESVRRKVALLEAEGVVWCDGRLRDASALYRFR